MWEHLLEHLGNLPRRQDAQQYVGTQPQAHIHLGHLFVLNNKLWTTSYLKVFYCPTPSFSMLSGSGSHRNVRGQRVCGSSNPNFEAICATVLMWGHITIIRVNLLARVFKLGISWLLTVQSVLRCWVYLCMNLRNCCLYSFQQSHRGFEPVPWALTTIVLKHSEVSNFQRLGRYWRRLTSTTFWPPVGAYILLFFILP